MAVRPFIALMLTAITAIGAIDHGAGAIVRAEHFLLDLFRCIGFPTVYAQSLRNSRWATMPIRLPLIISGLTPISSSRGKHLPLSWCAVLKILDVRSWRRETPWSRYPGRAPRQPG